VWGTADGFLVLYVAVPREYYWAWFLLLRSDLVGDLDFGLAIERLRALSGLPGTAVLRWTAFAFVSLAPLTLFVCVMSPVVWIGCLSLSSDPLLLMILAFL
jgi:hypothetical protein